MDGYEHLTERLNELITETGCVIRERDVLEEVRVNLPMFVEVVSVEDDCDASATVIRAISQNDPVLFAPDEECIEIDLTGSWDNRTVSIVVTIPHDSEYDEDEDDDDDECDNDYWNVTFIFETSEAGYNGSNVISFRWDFHPSNIVNLGVAGMKFGDHLGCVNVQPPDYVRAFVSLCRQAHYETIIEPREAESSKMLQQLLVIAQDVHGIQPANFSEITKEDSSVPITIPTGRYRHYKGKEYIVIGVARHSETQEQLVTYRQEYGDLGLWVRPLKMFLETVQVDGHMIPRFEHLGD